MALKVIDILVKSADIGSCGKFYSYVVIKVDNKIFKTRKSHQPLYPSWDSDCSFLLLPKAMPDVRFFLFDAYDDSLVGEALLTYEEIDLTNKIDYCIPLESHPNSRTRKGFKFTGVIYVRAEINSPGSGMFTHFGKPLLDFHVRLQPGDIVLINHSRIDGVLVSAGTASRWNHIGIIIPGNGDNMMLFEATVAGVSISNLEDCLLGWKRSNPGISFGFRRLINIPSTDRNIIEEKLRSFATQHADKPYGIMEIAKGLFTTNNKDDYNSFFCSELVAACWKKIGILSADKSSSNFFPSTFGKKNFPLEHGVILTDIIIYKDWIDPEKYRYKSTSQAKLKCRPSLPLIPLPIVHDTPKPPKKEKDPVINNDVIVVSIKQESPPENLVDHPPARKSARKMPSRSKVHIRDPQRKSMDAFKDRIRRPFSNPSPDEPPNKRRTIV